MVRLRAILAAMLVVASTLSACAQRTAAYTNVAPATINPGDPLPRPAETPILTVAGLVPGAPVRLDRPTLRAMGTISYTVEDPFAGRPITYEGVLISRLLDVLGADRGASILHLVALNDYESDITVADMRRWPVILAFAADGKVLSITEKGPLMVVFPIHAYDIDMVTYESQWVWQVASIEVRS